MTEWRLFPEGTIPDFTTTAFFEAHPWVPGDDQIGHAERLAMVVQAVTDLIAKEPALSTVSDIGCGDGSFLALLRDRHPRLRAWGYDAGTGNMAAAARVGVDARQADILAEPLEYGQLVTVTEVIEHLLDPHAFVRSLPAGWLIATSPSAEDDVWHYEQHAWAWDLPGYRQLFEEAGWTVADQRECASEKPFNHGTALWRTLRFQAVTAFKET